MSAIGKQSPVRLQRNLLAVTFSRFDRYQGRYRCPFSRGSLEHFLAMAVLFPPAT